jgi:5-methylthioribose kinase
MPYEPLSIDSLPRRLGAVEDIAARIGGAADWKVIEVGDGNLNLVFIVTGRRGRIVVKQALPYVRAAGESWPLSLNRAFYEHHALQRLGGRAPGRMPELFCFDETQAIQIIEHLSPHTILRRELIAGKVFPNLAVHLGTYLAESLFRGSDLCLPPAQRKADAALFLGNVELSGITEDLFFTDPYHQCSRNHYTPGLDVVARAVRQDRELKLAALELKQRFCTAGQTLLHGDLHTGSIMVDEGDTKVIDAEFATYGPMGFDIGSLFGNLWLACFSQPAHRATDSACSEYRDWLLRVVADIWNVFTRQFTQLWQTERHGILGGQELFDLQGDARGAELVLQSTLQSIWQDTLGFAGLEMHRRILGFAHVADFETIADEVQRAACEVDALAAGRRLVMGRRSIATVAQACDLVATGG